MQQCSHGQVGFARTSLSPSSPYGSSCASCYLSFCACVWPLVDPLLPMQGVTLPAHSRNPISHHHHHHHHLCHPPPRHVHQQTVAPQAIQCHPPGTRGPQQLRVPHRRPWERMRRPRPPHPRSHDRSWQGRSDLIAHSVRSAIAFAVNNHCLC